MNIPKTIANITGQDTFTICSRSRKAEVVDARKLTCIALFLTGTNTSEATVKVHLDRTSFYPTKESLYKLIDTDAEMKYHWSLLLKELGEYYRLLSLHELYRLLGHILTYPDKYICVVADIIMVVIRSRGVETAPKAHPQIN